MSRRTEKEARRKARQREDDLRWFIGAPAGRRILRELIDSSGYARPQFAGNSSDAFRIGQQKLVAGLVDEIKSTALEDFHRLELESRAQQQLDAAANADGEDDDVDE